MKFFPQNLLFTGALTLVLAVTAFILPALPVWITDNGNKYIIMRNFAEHKTVKLQHPVPELAPTGGFHIQHHEGALRSFYPEFYPVLCSFFYSKNCERAASIPAIAGTLLAAWVVLLWTKSKAAAAFTALGTPLFFYSFVLWEMTLSCAAVTCALFLLFKKRHTLAAGLIIGLSLFLREEAYFVSGSLIFALLCFREFKSSLLLFCGIIAGMVPVWLWQYIEFGNILGLHGKTYLAGTGTQSLSGVLWNYFHHLLRCEPTGAGYEKYITIVPLVLLFCGSFFRNRKVKFALLGVMLLSGVVMLLKYIQTPGISYAAACSTGLFAAMPACWIFFADLRSSFTRQAKIYRILALFAVVYIATVPAVLTRGDVGLIWSARHFIVIAPVLVILSAKCAKNIHLQSIVPFAAVGVFAIAQQLSGIHSLNTISKESLALENLIRSHKTQAVISDVFYLPEMTPRLWFENTFLDISKPQNAGKLVENMPEKVLLVLSAAPQFRRISNQDLSRILQKCDIKSAPQRFRMERGTGFIDLIILPVSAKEAKL